MLTDVLAGVASLSTEVVDVVLEVFAGVVPALRAPPGPAKPTPHSNA